MADPKTWILTKSTSYPPNDFRLQLGQVLRDPRLPMQPLFPSTDNPPPEMSGMQIAENVTKGVVVGKGSSLARCFGLWANTSVVPADGVLAAAEERHTWWEWRLDELVDKATSFSDEHVRSLVKTNAIVKRYIRDNRIASLGLKLFPGLFIVTGLRIAKGAKMEMASTLAVAGQLKFQVNVNPKQVPAANVGLLAQATRLRQEHASFTEAQDFIFAYQCVEIMYFPVTVPKQFTGGDTQMGAPPPPKRQRSDEGQGATQGGVESEDEDEFEVHLRQEEFGALGGDVAEDEVLFDTDASQSPVTRVNIILEKDNES
ncbi:hypothetical protein BR93DRAFT_228209 [Coniochaeta sp. PMI_546]|nr:hypothetical protein BR93DRAFT_228209 [Coniochaeta sp. PMI_546]